MLNLASWNVNSLKIRLDQVLAWMDTHAIDVLAMQETKTTDEQFPVAAFQALGFHCVYSGQKTYNGVAVISRYPISDMVMDIPDFEDPQRRVLAVTTAGIRLINLYVPNGSTVNSDKYQYKLQWLEKVTDFVYQESIKYPALAIVGDFNIAPTDVDVHDPDRWEGQVLVSPQERVAFSKLMAIGFTDSFRKLHPSERAFSWWDYRMLGFRRNHGLRIDHILLSDVLGQRCHECQIDLEPRRAERPSDHAPIWVQLANPPA